MFYLYGSAASVDNVVLILVYEVALALLVVIDLLPLEAREALWTVAAPAHMGGRRGDCTPHLALHLPSYHSPYSQYTPPFSSAAHNVLLPFSPFHLSFHSFHLHLDPISTPWEVAAEKQEPEQGKPAS